VEAPLKQDRRMEKLTKTEVSLVVDPMVYSF
jgi:hypothetical protein